MSKFKAVLRRDSMIIKHTDLITEEHGYGHGLLCWCLFLFKWELWKASRAHSPPICHMVLIILCHFYHFCRTYLLPTVAHNEKELSSRGILSGPAILSIEPCIEPFRQGLYCCHVDFVYFQLTPVSSLSLCIPLTPAYRRPSYSLILIWKGGSKYSQEQNVHFDGHWKSWLTCVI